MTKTNFKTMAKLLAAVAVVAVLGGACTKEMAPDPTTIRLIRNINATATMPQQSADKAYLHTSDRKVFWQPNDTISINGTAIRTHSIDPSDSTKAEFTGTIGAYTHTVEAVDYDCYWAVYPTSIRSSSSESGLVVSLPSSQTYNSSSPLNGTTYMAAHTDATPSSYYLGFEMKNLVTVLKLTLTGTNGGNDSLSKIVVSHSSQNLCGTFTTAAPTTTISYSSSGGKSLTINCTDGTHNYMDISSAKEVYIALPPLTNSGTLTMQFYNTDDCYTTKTLDMGTGSISLARNTIYTSTINNVAFDKVVGKFSVASNRQVIFSPGNLQYKAGDGSKASPEWRFAEHQYTYIGNAAGNTTAAASRSTQADWIDLFGWGTSGWNNTTNDPYAIYYQPWEIKGQSTGPDENKQGYGPSTNMTDLNLVGTSANYDWGVFNDIGSDPAGTWRTLTQSEWIWLLGPTQYNNSSPGKNCRTSSTVNGTANARFAKATVVGVSGLIIFPDTYTHPSGPAQPININTKDAAFGDNNYDAAAWAKMEDAGCAFLPSAGDRYEINVSNAGSRGLYWSSTYRASTYAHNLVFDSGQVRPDLHSNRFWGNAVRLVKDI